MADPEITAAMAELTAARDELLVDTGIATRPADMGQTPTLDADGNVTVPAGTQVYAGPCVISQPTTALLGGRTVDDQAGVPDQRVLKVPHSADLRAGDLFTVTACAFSPGLAGDVLLVVGELERTFATYRRFLLRGSSWVSPEAGP